jgi:hypothetical protein
MNGDRRGRRSHLRSIEVMNVTQTRPSRGDETDRPTAEIARLFDIAGREDEAIPLFHGGVTRLHQVQQAKAALKGLTACELRAALELRRQLPRGEPA